MRSTRRTLLDRVRDPGDREAWDLFYELYAPLIYQYARARGLTPTDAEEIRDQCLELLGRKMPTFEYDRSKGRFKSWLFRIVSGRVIDHLRRRGIAPAVGGNTTALGEVPAPDVTPEEVWESRWRLQHLEYCLSRARAAVSEQTTRVFELLLQERRSVPEVCAELGLNANQVYKAKQRMLAQVRTELGRLED